MSLYDDDVPLIGVTPGTGSTLAPASTSASAPASTANNPTKTPPAPAALKAAAPSWSQNSSMLNTQMLLVKKKQQQAKAAKTHGTTPITVLPAAGSVVTSVILKSKLVNGPVTVRAEEVSNPEEPFILTDAARQPVDNPYDPFRPNDYEQVKAAMQRMAEEESHGRRRSRDSVEDEYDDDEYAARAGGLSDNGNERAAAFAPPPELSYSASNTNSNAGPSLPVSTWIPPPAPAAIVEDVKSGEEAFLRRGQLSTKRPAEESLAESNNAKRPANESQSHSDSFNNNSEQRLKQLKETTQDVAKNLMKQMGWKEGQGLGRSDQGMSVPLQVKHDRQGGGRILPPTQTSKAVAASQAPCNVILLENMVGPGEVDADLKPEVTEECSSKYGTVTNVTIHETPSMVRIFVEFARKEYAVKALMELNGRFFGGRAVTASFYDPVLLAKNQLDA